MNTRLLRKIQKEILAEPLRFDMRLWLDQTSDVAPCGAAACIAGWAVLMDLQQKQGIDWREAAGKAQAKEQNTVKGFYFFDRARKLLALTDPQGRRLFFLERWPTKFIRAYHDRWDHCCKGPGRRQQAAVKMAALTVKRIDHFIATKGRE